MSELPREELSGEERANVGAGLSLDVDAEGIAVLEFDQPGSAHNRFTPELIERFIDLIAEVRSGADSGEIKGLVIASGKRDSFIAGMDISTMVGLRSAAAATTGARQGQLAFAAVAELAITTVTAINGTCLGGATELALACDYRIAADSNAVSIGLPEVTLGIIPGFGGSQRLPRRIALERALPMILTGRPINARRALRFGLVDAVVPARLLEAESKRWAGRGRRRGRPVAPEDRPLPRRIRRWLLESNPFGRRTVFRQAERGVAKATKGHYPAPKAALRVMRKGLRLPFEDALRLEAEAIGELLVSDVARNLMGIFFMRQAARRISTEDVEPVRRLGVLGAGIMGGGIAQLAAYRGVQVRVKDIAIGALEQAMSTAFRRFESLRRKRKLSPCEVTRAMGLIAPTLEYRGFRGTQLVIEAVIEKLEVKHEVLAAIEAATVPGTVIASNTSSLTLAAMAPALSDPTRFVGLHFFNPVHRMPLVEVVRGESTSDAAVATTTAFAVAMGKVPVVVADSPGFFVNRVLGPYMNEAMLLLQEGNTIAAVDEALEQFGMPMGPLRLLDEVGLDVSVKVGQQLAPVFGERVPQADAAARLHELGRLGRKNGAGFYLYGEAGQSEPDAEIEPMLTRERTPISAAEIVDRCVLVTLNEACYALADGVVDSAQAADLAMVMGTGFAPFRGGIFRYAEAVGLDAVVERMDALAARMGPRFEPADLLRSMADSGETFYPSDWPRKLDSL